MGLALPLILAELWPTVFLRKWSVSSKCRDIFCSIPLLPCVHIICNNVLYFIFHIGNLSSLLFFIDLAEICQLCWHLKAALTSLFQFAILFFYFQFCCCCFIFPFFLALDLFCSLLSRLLKCEFRLRTGESCSATAWIWLCK